MVLGFNDTMRMLPKKYMAELFFKYMTVEGLSIKDAWIKMASYEDDNPYLTQIGTGVVIFDTVVENDFLPGYGSYARGTTFTINKSKVEGLK